MEVNHRFIGGKLKPAYYSCYADYFVKCIQTMREHGICIHAITPQNEPSMLPEANEQAAFIGRHLGPALKNAGLGDV